MLNLPFDWNIFGDAAARIALAYALALPSGWLSEAESHSAGVRTFPIVAMASCGLMLLMRGSGPDATAADSRVLQGLITGIGFVGGGAILKQGMTVQGTATAASILNTGAIGAAAALGKNEVAVLLAVLNLFTLKAMVPLRNRLDRNRGRVENNGGIRE